MSAGELCSWCDAPAAVELGTTEAACTAHSVPNYAATVAAMRDAGRLEIVAVSW